MAPAPDGAATGGIQACPPQGSLVRILPILQMTPRAHFMSVA